MRTRFIFAVVFSLLCCASMARAEALKGYRLTVDGVAADIDVGGSAELTLPDGRKGLGLAVRAPQKFQFTYLETQVVVDPQTFLPLVVRDVLTWPAYELPAGTTIAEEEFKIIEATDDEPRLPSGVTVNGEVESSIIER